MKTERQILLENCCKKQAENGIIPNIINIYYYIDRFYELHIVRMANNTI